MYYESIKASLEQEFKYNNLGEDLKFKAFDLLNKLSDNFDKLSNSKPNLLAAAIAFFVLSTDEQPRNFKQMEDDFGVDAKKLALKAKEIAPLLDVENYEEIIKNGLILTQANKPKRNNPVPIDNTTQAAINSIKEVLPELAKNEKAISEQLLKAKRKVSIVEIKDEEFIIIVKEFRNFTYHLYKDKDYMEIKQFIKLLELNMFMAGYDISNTDIEKKFGDLFLYFGFEPKKGREQDKFVNLKDRFGNSEPFSLIKLGE